MALGLFGVILVISLLGCICLVVLRDRVVYGDGVCPPTTKMRQLMRFGTYHVCVVF